MVVLQFAVGDDPTNPHLPRNHEQHAVVYTGTHDNDTTQGWFDSLSPQEQAWTELDPAHPAWNLIEVAWSSRAALAIAPLQDVLELGTEARMNLPGTEEGNWQWRFHGRALTAVNASRLRELSARTHRS
jgi:4-alpha-glucanotransferase